MSGESRDRTIVTKESEQLILGIQRQNERLRSAVSILQDCMDANNNIIIVLFQRLKLLENRIAELEVRLEEKKEAPGEKS